MPIIHIESEDQWHALRMQHVGGSEVAALCGASSFLTKFQLHCYKSGSLQNDFDENERIFWGNELETAIISGVGKRLGVTLYKCRGYYSSDAVPGMGCTPDAIYYDGGTAFVVQIKMADYGVWKEWGDEPSLSYQLQLQRHYSSIPNAALYVPRTSSCKRRVCVSAFRSLIISRITFV